MKTQIKTFNTGRGYSPEGQVITALVQEHSKTLFFNDHTRGISGCWKLEDWEWDLFDDLEVETMSRYDAGGYEHSSYAAELRREDEEPVVADGPYKGVDY